METLVKLLKTIAVILVFVLVTFLTFKYGKNFLIKFEFNPKTSKTNNPMESYSINSKSLGDVHYIDFKDVIGTAAPSQDGRTVYYNLDITISTSSSATLEKINSEQSQTVAVIRKTLGQFRQEDVSNTKGKQYMKEQLKDALNKQLGEDADVDAVYFGKFLYQAQ